MNESIFPLNLLGKSFKKNRIMEQQIINNAFYSAANGFYEQSEKNLALLKDEKTLPYKIFIEGVINFKKGEVEVGLSKLLDVITNKLTLPNFINVYLNCLDNPISPELLRQSYKKLTNFFIEKMSKNENLEELACYINFIKYPDNNIAISSIISEEIFVPIINAAYANGFVDLALQLEGKYYGQYEKLEQNEIHFKKVIQPITSSAIECGRAFSESLFCKNSLIKSTENKLLIFVHNAYLMAHVMNIFHVLKGIQQIKNSSLDFCIVTFEGFNDEMQKAFDSINIPIIRLDINKKNQLIKNYMERMINLKMVIEERKINKIVWGCYPVFMNFVFGMRLCPEQIWWSQKWHNLSSPVIDRHISIYSFKKEVIIHGQKWQSVVIQTDIESQIEYDDETVKIRERFPSDVIILGSLGREEKLKNPEFLEVVSEILKRSPKSIFIWTGRKKLKSIQDIFIKNGIDKQTFFVGWVDTKVYSKVIDILLDSFPFGNGVTARYAMEAAKPIVSMASPKNFQCNFDSIIWPIFNDSDIEKRYRTKAEEIFFDKSTGKFLYQRANNAEEYIKKSLELIDDREYREKVGSSYKNFIKELMSNPSETAKDYLTIFSS